MPQCPHAGHPRHPQTLKSESRLPHSRPDLESTFFFSRCVSLGERWLLVTSVIQCHWGAEPPARVQPVVPGPPRTCGHRPPLPPRASPQTWGQLRRSRHLLNARPVRTFSSLSSPRRTGAGRLSYLPGKRALKGWLSRPKGSHPGGVHGQLLVTRLGCPRWAEPMSEPGHFRGFWGVSFFLVFVRQPEYGHCGMGQGHPGRL